MSPAESERLRAMARLLLDSGHLTPTGKSQLVHLADAMQYTLDADELADTIREGAMGYEDETGTYHPGAVNFWDDDIDEHVLAKHVLVWLKEQGVPA